MDYYLLLMKVSQILLWLLLNPVCGEVLLLLLKFPPVRRSLLESLLSLIFINMLVLVSEKVVFVRLSVIQFLLHVRQLVWGVGSVLAHFYRRLVFSLSDWILDEVCHFLEEIQFQGLLLLVGQVLSIFEMLFHLLRLYLPGHFSVLGPQRVPHRGLLIWVDVV